MNLKTAIARVIIGSFWISTTQAILISQNTSSTAVCSAYSRPGPVPSGWDKCPTYDFESKSERGNYPNADITIGNVIDLGSDNAFRVTVHFKASEGLSLSNLGEVKIIGVQSPEKSTYVLFSRNSNVYDISSSKEWNADIIVYGSVLDTETCTPKFEIQYDWFSGAGSSNDEEDLWPYTGSYDYLVDCVDGQADGSLYCWPNIESCTTPTGPPVPPTSSSTITSPSVPPTSSSTITSSSVPPTSSSLITSSSVPPTSPSGPSVPSTSSSLITSSSVPPTSLSGPSVPPTSSRVITSSSVRPTSSSEITSSSVPQASSTSPPVPPTTTEPPLYVSGPLSEVPGTSTKVSVVTAITPGTTPGAIPVNPVISGTAVETDTNSLSLATTILISTLSGQNGIQLTAPAIITLTGDAGRSNASGGLFGLAVFFIYFLL